MSTIYKSSLRSKVKIELTGDHTPLNLVDIGYTNSKDIYLLKRIIITGRHSTAATTIKDSIYILHIKPSYLRNLSSREFFLSEQRVSVNFNRSTTGYSFYEQQMHAHEERGNIIIICHYLYQIKYKYATQQKKNKK